jgi:hypothetical protein
VITARIDCKSSNYQQAQNKLRLAKQLNHCSVPHDDREKTLLGLIAVELDMYAQVSNTFN